jgi:hypothetical protein
MSKSKVAPVAKYRAMKTYTEQIAITAVTSALPEERPFQISAMTKLF